MTTKALLPLDSYRLVQYAQPLPCYICGGENQLDAELCRHCQAPMSLVHQTGNKKVVPRIISVLGSAGAGKTVYLGMLMDILSRQTDQFQILTRGAFSISLQQNTMAALERCEFPLKTPSEPDRWNWVHCQIRAAARRRPTELIVPDMAGEAINTEIDHPHSFPVIHALLAKCRGMMIIVDAAGLEAGGHDQDFQAMKMLSYLSELDKGSKRKRNRRRLQRQPVAIVFTKADQCDACFADPLAYARRHTPGLWKVCQEHFSQFGFFASGVAGACTWRREFGNELLRVPMRVEPRGIVEPFRWLVDHLKK
jgi:hypothetical protein